MAACSWLNPGWSGRGKSRSVLRTYECTIGPLARAHLAPPGMRAKRSLHMQSPAVLMAATWTLARTPPAVMASPSMLLGSLRGLLWPSSG
eukprot:7356655-Alexandrium_andersonii.AAC.1